MKLSDERLKLIKEIAEYPVECPQMIPYYKVADLISRWMGLTCRGARCPFVPAKDNDWCQRVCRALFPSIVKDGIKRGCPCLVSGISPDEIMVVASKVAHYSNR